MMLSRIEILSRTSSLLTVTIFLPIYLLLQFSKETRHARWRAYAKGCVDLCDRYSLQAVTARASLNDVAPKDVKMLEVLKPHQELSMRERYKQSLEKEKRLEAASRPVEPPKKKQANAKKGKEGMQKDDEQQSKPKKSKRGGRKSSHEKAENGAAAGAALDQDDNVEEGINWSDEEED